MAKKSNAYVIFYTVALTVICGSLLALASEGLRGYIEANELFDKKKNILATTMDISSKSRKEVNDLYDKLVKTYVVDAQGNIVEDKEEDIDIKKEYAKKEEKLKDRLLPIYEIATEDNPDQTAYYVFPMYGFGLWDFIWGWIALESDFNTIKGVVFGQQAETPGLGARITDELIETRYIGKKIFEGEDIAAVIMQKGEGNDYKDEPHKVDGMAGATITGKGLNKMLSEYFDIYKPFISSKQGNETASLSTQE